MLRESRYEFTCFDECLTVIKNSFFSISETVSNFIEIYLLDETPCISVAGEKEEEDQTGKEATIRRRHGLEKCKGDGHIQIIVENEKHNEDFLRDRYVDLESGSDCDMSQGSDDSFVLLSTETDGTIRDEIAEMSDEFGLP